MRLNYDVSELDAERKALQEGIVTAYVTDTESRLKQITITLKEYQKKYDGLTERFNGAKARLEEVGRAITERQAKREKIGRFVSRLEQMDGPFTAFREDDWYSLVDLLV